MDLLAFLLFPILALVTVAIWLSPKSKGRRLRISFMTFGIPFLVFFLDEILGQVYLRAMCTFEGGYKVSEPVRADGYYSTYRDTVHAGCALDCLQALLVHKFQYFETDVKYQYPYFTNQQGVHRFFLVDRETGKCLTEGQQTSGGWGKIPPDKCIAYTRSAEPTSKFEVSMATMDFWDSTNKIGLTPIKLQRNYSYVKDRGSGKIVGSETTYWYWGGWVRNNAIAHNSATACPNLELSHRAIFDKIIVAAGVGEKAK